MMKKESIKDMKEKLLVLIKERALFLGQRKLASGKMSNCYIDGKLITCDPEGLYLVSKIILTIIEKDKIDAIGGMTMGADPIAAGVALLSYLEGRPIKAFIVRPAPKDHGMGKLIEGHIQKGWSVAIVEDVITTGGSALKAIRAVEEAGAVVKKVIAIVDRLEGAREALAEKNIPLEAIFTKDDVDFSNNLSSKK
ncbi:MAG: orotate phosphoribosyltransferase [Candidatus Omnitrophica bacterium]|nr:orotate phosphoribosyltransferase [Candidatus Omnitrophota bacterium]MCM8777856.1 orotate phosphoribosyltransferase [Candidatus Omnitrophota bacterium]